MDGNHTTQPFDATPAGVPAAPPSADRPGVAPSRHKPLQRRSRLKRGTCQLRRVRIRKVSAKRRAEQPLYQAAKLEAFEGSGGRCTWPGCTKCAVDPHHVKKLGRGGARCDASNIAPLCREHHDQTEINQAAAEAVGLLVSGRQPVTPSPLGRPWSDTKIQGKD